MTIEQRVAKLERQNRWMKRGGGLALAVVACVVLMGQGKPKELPDLVGKSLTLKTKKGTIWFEVTRRGTGGVLQLSADDPSEFVMLLASDELKYLAVHNGLLLTPQVVVGVDRNDTSIVAVRDKDGRQRAAMFEHPDGHGAFVAFDKTLQPAWRAPARFRWLANTLPIQTARRQCEEYFGLAHAWWFFHNKKWPDSLKTAYSFVKADPWSRPYRLVADGDKARVISLGADGKEGTKDDIVFPERDR